VFCSKLGQNTGFVYLLKRSDQIIL